MKNHFRNNWYLYLIGVLIVLIIIKLLKDKATPFKLGGSFGSNNNNGGVLFSTEPDDTTIVLQNGSSGNEVRTLQNLMNEYINTHNGSIDWYEDGSNAILFPINPDGDFGSLTETLLFTLTGQNTISLDEWNSLMSV